MSAIIISKWGVTKGLFNNEEKTKRMGLGREGETEDGREGGWEQRCLGSLLYETSPSKITFNVLPKIPKYELK